MCFNGRQCCSAEICAGELDFVQDDCLVKSFFYMHTLDTKLINIAQ